MPPWCLAWSLPVERTASASSSRRWSSFRSIIGMLSSAGSTTSSELIRSPENAVPGPETASDLLVEHDRRVLDDPDGVDGHRRHVRDDGTPDAVGERRSDVADEEPRGAVVAVDELHVEVFGHVLESTTFRCAGSVVRDGRHVLDAADLEAGTRQRSDGRLCARAGVLLLVPAGTANADVNAVDARGLDLLGDRLGHLHGRVRRGLVAVLLDDGPTRGLRDGLGTGEVGDGDDGVVERCVHVGDAPLLFVAHSLSPARSGCSSSASGLFSSNSTVASSSTSTL